MKKVLVMLLVMVGLLAVPNVSLAANWVTVNRKIDSEYAIDLDSVRVIRYDPPFYVIEDIERLTKYSGGSIEGIYRYFYDYDNKEVRRQDIALRDVGDSWTYAVDVGAERPPEIAKEGTIGEVLANLAFQKAYNMRFR